MKHVELCPQRWSRVKDDCKFEVKFSARCSKNGAIGQNTLYAFLPPKGKITTTVWAALPKLVYWALTKTDTTRWSKMAEGKGPKPI